VARTIDPAALPALIPVGASSTTKDENGEALHPLAPMRYGSGAGFPLVTLSAVTNTLGVVNSAMGKALLA